MAKKVLLNHNTPSVQYLCSKDKRLARVIQMVGPIRYTTHEENPFAFLVHEIIEQMLSVKAAAKIYSRFVTICDGSITPKSVSGLSFEQIKATGTSSKKAKCIIELSKNILSGALDLGQLEDKSDSDVMNILVSQPGIGPWTAKMYLIFVLDRSDILPFEDAAFLQSYHWIYKTNDYSVSAIKQRCKKWKPFSSVAARYLYRALDTGLTKSEFHLYK